MDEQTVRASADATGAALVAGDVDAVIGRLSPELQRHPGEVVALLPLPASEVTIASVQHTGAAFVVVLHVVAPTEDVELQTRWKDRDGVARIVEVSHLSRTEREPAPSEAEADQGTATAADPGG